jgi:hypothetical protein
MKTEDFKRIVESIVRAELKRQLPKLVPQILAEALTAKKPNVPNVPAHRPAAPQPQLKGEKKYVSNPILNTILNETTVKIKPENSSYATYSEQPTSEAAIDFNVTDEVKSDSNEMIDYSLLNDVRQPAAPVMADITPVNEDQAKVLGKINRDFRSMMKSIDAAKKNGVGAVSNRVSFEA